MNRTKGRFNIPQNPSDLLALAKKIATKHQADGANSVLRAAQDYNWDSLLAEISTCETHHIEAEKAARKAEEHYRERDKILTNIKEATRNAAALIKAIYAKNPKIAGDWGLSVDDSPKATKSVKPKEKTMPTNETIK